MRVYLSIIIASFFILQNCERQQVIEDQNNIEGRWLETSPVENRIELIFQSNNQLIHKQRLEQAQTTFTYEIVGDSISLSLNEADVAQPMTVFFNRIEKDKLQIGNFSSSNTTHEIIQMRKIE